MEFWSDFSKTVSGAADKTAREAERLAAVAKCKYRINRLKSLRDETLLTVGRLRYAEHTGQTVTEAEYAGLFDKIEDLETRLKEAREALADCQGGVPCPACGFRCRKDLNFCPKCGAPLSAGTDRR